jgi:lipoprotein NlpD
LQLQNLAIAPGLRIAVWCAAVLLAGCATSMNPAPVSDRSSGRPGGAAGAAMPAPNGAASGGPFADKAGQPGYYTVKQGDTLMRIALDNGQAWRDIARWNNIDNPNVIEVGQVLRVAPPPGEAVVVKPVAAGTTVETRPLSAAGPAGAASAPVKPASAPPAPAAPTALSTESAEDDVAWAWPASGAIVGGFDEAKNKGLDIAGRLGDPVYAAGDGRVVYAGSGLRGYGNLVIIKHNATYLSAYAHNNKLLVKEGDVVKRGQRIAEMGSSDADRVKLHFEIRKQGKPVDPAKWLPAK